MICTLQAVCGPDQASLDSEHIETLLMCTVFFIHPKCI